jgi:hypothetical protein
MQELRTARDHSVLGQGPALRIALVSAIVAVAALRFRSSLLPMTRLDVICLAEYAFIYFAALAITALYAGFAERLPLRRILSFRGLIFPTAAMLGVGAYNLGMHQFGGWDEGLITHIAACYHQGLKPYVDYPCSLPPLFMAVIRCAAAFFGLRWAFLSPMVTAAFAVLTALWLFALLRLAAVERHWALVITICAQLSTLWVTPFWWFNNSSSVSVVLLFASTVACLQQPRRLLLWISVAFALAMVVASKPNDLPATLMVFALLATRDRRQWMKVSLVCVAAAGLMLLICYIAQMPPRLLLASYVEIGKLRGSPLNMFGISESDWPEKQLLCLFILFTMLSFWGMLVRAARCHQGGGPLLFTCAIAALTSMEMVATNSEMKTSDLCVVLVAFAILCLRPWQIGKVGPARKAVLVAMLALFFCMAGLFSFTHQRILNIGEKTYYEPLPTRTLQSGFFAGLQAGPRLCTVLAQSAQVLSRYPGQRVFFGPRMEFGYAAFKQPAISGSPLLWDPGNLYSPRRSLQLLLNFQKQDPGLLIFLKDDYTRMGPVGFYIQHSSTYRRIDDFNELTVYLRNPEVPIVSARIPPGILQQ